MSFYDTARMMAETEDVVDELIALRSRVEELEASLENTAAQCDAMLDVTGASEAYWHASFKAIAARSRAALHPQPTESEDGQRMTDETGT